MTVMNRNKKIFNTAVTFTVAASCLLTEIFAPMEAFAAQSKVNVDETLYLNLDYYGAVSKANVVKGLTFNSLDSYTDYGNYESITNMSTDDQPENNSDGSVTWKAPSGRSKFFFEGTMDPKSIEMPWTFDVTYKVNGVVTDADKIAGASGLIEMDIDATPNKNVSTYMQNNMMLIVAVPVDMSKCYSIDAPDSQTQSVGETTAVVFMALPGKEGHFVVRTGTDSYESIGAIMMMTPGTLGQLSDIKDVKEVEDKFRANTNAMMDDVESIMDNVTDVQSQLALTNKALDSLKSGKDKLHTAKDGIFSGNDVAIGDLRNLLNTLTPLDSSLKTTQWMIYDINNNLNKTDSDLMTTSSKLKTLITKLKQLSSSMGDVDAADTADMKKELSDAETALKSLNATLGTNVNSAAAKFNTDTDKIAENYVASMSDAQEDSDIYKSMLQQYQDKLAELENASAASAALVKDIVAGTATTAEKLKYQAIVTAVQTGNIPTGYETVYKAVYGLVDLAKQLGTTDYSSENQQTIAETKALLAAQKANLESQINAANSTAKGATIAAAVTDFTPALQSYIASVSDVSGTEAEDLIEKIGSVSDQIEDITEDGASVSYNTATTLNSMRDIIGDLDGLVGVMDSYYDDTQSLIENSESVLEQMQTAGTSAANALQNINDTIRSASSDFGNATDAGIQAGREAVDNSGNIVDNTKNLKNSGADLRKSINDELDEKEDENNFMNMDPEAPKVSLTSDKNQEPDSIQIVCRTDEISVDDNDNETLDAEEAEESATPLQRIMNLFKKIGQVLKDIFNQL